MHSSRMRTGRTMTVRGDVCSRGLSAPGGGGVLGGVLGGSAPGGGVGLVLGEGWVCSGGVSAPGGCLLRGEARGMCLGGVCSWGVVSAPYGGGVCSLRWGGCVLLGGCAPRGCLLPGGVQYDLSHHAFDVTCMLPPRQLRLNTSAAAYILLAHCMLGYHHPPPPVNGMNDRRV